MDTEKQLTTSLKDILALARLAPSVHNTQPWHVEQQNDTLIISINRKYQLTDGDPTGRETIISLGIFAEAVSLSATRFSFTTKNVHFENNRAIIQFQLHRGAREKTEDIEALKTRVTDRSVYNSAEMEPSSYRTIMNSARGLKAKVWILYEKEAINKIADLTAHGIGVALSNPSFREELSQYLVVPWSSKQRGISTSSLYIPKLLAVCEPLFMRLGVGLKSEVELEHRRWASASAIILITTAGDIAEYWFEAGRAYLRVALKVEQLGLSQATSAATVEASNYHEDVEALVHTKQRLQSVLRVGKGAKHRNHSPRVTVEELIT